jgi:hypothetical protein
MTPVKPPITNCVFTAPEDLDASQVNSIHAYRESIPTGNLEGATFIVVAWQPSPDEIKALQEGGSIFLSCLGSLPPHFLTTKFSEATYGRIVLE